MQRAPAAPLSLHSTREPGEGAGLLANGSSSDKRVGAFDVEFEYEDDVLLNWQHARWGGVLRKCFGKRGNGGTSSPAAEHSSCAQASSPSKGSSRALAGSGK